MQKYHAFLRWWMFFIPIVVGLYIAGLMGFYQQLYIKDHTKLSFLTLAIFIVSSMWCGRQTWKLTQTTTIAGVEVSINKEHQIKSIGMSYRIMKFLTYLCMALGMVGTIVGFIIALDSKLEGIVLTDHDQVQIMMAQIKSGMGTALYTTLIGLVSSVLLSIQAFNLKYSLLRIA